jgi:hypothetical protein
MRYAPVSALLAALVPASGFAQELSASAGGSYSSGRYGGTERVEVATTYVGLSGTHSGWRVDATVPYLFIRSGGNAVDAGGIILPGEGGSSASGLGDATLRVSGPLATDAPFNIALGAQVKLPTGGREVSTGKLDAAADIELSREVGALTPFVAVGYRTYGDSSELELTNGWSLSAGSSLAVGSTGLILSYEWSESAVGGPASQEVLAVAAGALNRRVGWTIFGSKGLSSGAADFMLGAGVTRSFGRGPAARPRRTPRL